MTKQAASTAATDVPWSGYMAIRELKKPGGPLMAALLGCAAERDELLAEMARKVGCTPSYLSQLRNGLRKVSSISAKFSKACATYMGVSQLEVLVLAGQLTADSCVGVDGRFVEIAQVFAKRGEPVA